MNDYFFKWLTNNNNNNTMQIGALKFFMGSLVVQGNPYYC